MTSGPRSAGPFGLDWISASFPLSDVSPTPTEGIFSDDADDLSWHHAIPVGLTTAWIGFVYIPGKRFWGRVSLNSARVASTGWELCDLKTARFVLYDLLEPLRPFMIPAVWVNQWHVTRLDVAVDLLVDNPASVIEALAGQPRRYVRRARLYRDPITHSAQTLRLGSGAGMYSVYDKHAKTPNAPEGTLRAEAQFRKGWLRTAGVKLIKDLDDQKIAAMGWQRWEWARMGIEVGTAAAVVNRVRSMGWTSAEEERVFGRLFLRAFDQDPKTKRADPRIEALIDELGIVLSPHDPIDAGPSIRRLDAETRGEREGTFSTA
jgi:hypothetical protein